MEMEIKITAINLNGSHGKIYATIRNMKELELAFCFVAEPWIGPGKRIPARELIFHQSHGRSRNSGHYPYGIGVLYNDEILRKEDFTLIDQNPFYLCFEVKGVRFIGCYIPPQRHSDWLNKYLKELEILLSR